MTITPTPFLGFGGWPKSGKDTVADHLVAQHGWRKINMSAPIHELALVINPIVRATVTLDTARLRWAPKALRPLLAWFLPRVVEIERYADMTDRLGFTDAKTNDEYRRLLQDLGAGAREVIGSTVWVELAAKPIDELLAQGERVLLSGVRTPDEIKLVRSRSGVNVWVKRPSIGSDVQTSHDIENSVAESDFDRTIDNDGTLDDLYAKVEHLDGEYGA